MMKITEGQGVRSGCNTNQQCSRDISAAAQFTGRQWW